MTGPAEKRAEPTPEKWFVRDCPQVYGDIEIVLGDDFTIYIPLMATDWDDAKRARMRDHARLIAASHETAAERDRLLVSNGELWRELDVALTFVVVWAATYKSSHELDETHPQHQEIIDSMKAVLLAHGPAKESTT